jgi:hypothetical protein
VASLRVSEMTPETEPGCPLVVASVANAATDPGRPPVLSVIMLTPAGPGTGDSTPLIHPSAGVPVPYPRDVVNSQNRYQGLQQL